MARQRKTEGLELEWGERGSAPVFFADGLFDEGNPTMAEALRAATGSERSRVLLVADVNVVQRTAGLGTAIGRYVQAHGIELAGTPVVMGGGEKVKADGIQGVMRVATAAIEAKIGSNDAMVVLGGGSVLDVAGCAAAMVRGGVRLVRVPTTPASMVDAAFSTSAALNAKGVKDALRVPCRPAAVVISPGFADTVLDGVWRGGLGELVRFAAVSDAALMKRISKDASALRERDRALLAECIRDAVSARVRKGDTGFAQWSALRLEAMSSYKLPHGYAIPIGIAIDSAYAVEKGLMTPEDGVALRWTLEECGALDGLAHSLHLLPQADAILAGLDAWRLAHGAGGIVVPAGLGRPATVEEPDREAYRKIIGDFTPAAQAVPQNA